MLIVLLCAIGLTGATVLLHALGTWEAVARLSRAWPQGKPAHGFLATELLIMRVVGVLLLLHLLEAGMWAALYRLAGMIPELESAMYFSLTSYTTLGYGDVVLPRPWRLLGPIEAAVGILMFGWSIAILVAAMTKTLERRRLDKATEKS